MSRALRKPYPELLLCGLCERESGPIQRSPSPPRTTRFRSPRIPEPIRAKSRRDGTSQPHSQADRSERRPTALVRGAGSEIGFSNSPPYRCGRQPHDTRRLEMRSRRLSDLHFADNLRRTVRTILLLIAADNRLPTSVLCALDIREDQQPCCRARIFRARLRRPASGEVELKALHAGQQKAIEQATFVGMTADEQGEFKKRGLRIPEIIKFLEKNDR